MMRVFHYLGAMALFCGAAFGQSPSLPAFTATDVHSSPHTSTPQMRGGLLPGGLYQMRNATMIDLVRTAYGVEADNVVGGPSWVEWNRYDIVAKAPSGTTVETATLMLRSLLADRFKLVAHNDTKAIRGYALAAGKKPLLKEATEAKPVVNCRPVFRSPADRTARLLS